MELQMRYDGQGKPIPIFPLMRNSMNKTTGTFTSISAFHCVVAGSLTFTYFDNFTDTQAFLAGDVFCTPLDCASVQVVSGTFHLS